MSVHESTGHSKAWTRSSPCWANSTSPTGGCNRFVQRGTFTRSLRTSTVSKKRFGYWRPAGDAPAAFEIVGKASSEVDDWPPDRLLGRLRTVLVGRRSELLAADASLFDEGSWTPVGVQTYGRFMAIRNFDFWVDEQDIRVRSNAPATPADRPPNSPLTRCAAASGTSSANAPPYPTAPACSSNCTDRSKPNSAAVVDGRARIVDDLDHPDAIVQTDFLTFMLLACGRIDPETPPARTTTSSFAATRNSSAQLARNLRFTI